MRVYQQFDLDMGLVRKLVKEGLIAPQKIEDLLISLSRKGYTVLKSTANFMGIPRSLTIVKDATASVGSTIATKVRDDFLKIASQLGVERLFE